MISWDIFVLIIALCGIVLILLIAALALQQSLDERWSITNYRVFFEKGDFHLTFVENKWRVQIGVKSFFTHKWGEENWWAQLLRYDGSELKLVWMANSKGDAFIISVDPSDITTTS